MYSLTKFADRQMFACSVPPPCNDTLEEGFQQLSRIHFYLGYAPIDFMIEAVERASLKDIEKGKIQILFAVKEIQEYLSSSWQNISTGGSDKLNPGLYFDQAFQKILEHTSEVLDKAYTSPTGKSNLVKIETMLGLTQEVLFLNKILQEAGIKTLGIKTQIKAITDKYKKVFKLKSNYETLEGLKPFSAYEQAAKDSVLAQLALPYNFDYNKLSRIYLDHDDWIRTLLPILEEQKEIDTNPDYQFNSRDSQEVKDNFLTQIKSFNRLLQNGVVNYVLSFAASINKEAFSMVRKSQISAESYFERELNYHKKSLERIYSSREYHEEKIAKLEKNKAEYIKNKISDKAFYEQQLTVLYRQERNIVQTLAKLRENLFATKAKDTVTFTGDISTGFVTGEFSNTDKVMLIHKDPFVNEPEAVYAMIFSKQRYNELVETSSLAFNETLKSDTFKQASNFWSYGQLLQELSDSKIQKFFLGQEFDLVDNTLLVEKPREKVLEYCE